MGKLESTSKLSDNLDFLMSVVRGHDSSNEVPRMAEDILISVLEELSAPTEYYDDVWRQTVRRWLEDQKTS